MNLLNIKCDRKPIYQIIDKRIKTKIKICHANVYHKPYSGWALLGLPTLNSVTHILQLSNLAQLYFT